MRSLTTAAAAAALGVDRKLLDNILSKEACYLIGKGARGRARRIDFPALQRIAIALVLARDLGVSVARGLKLAEAVLVDENRGAVAIGSLIRLQFDLPQLNRAVEEAVVDTLEGFVTPKRGRPPHARTAAGTL